MTSSSQTSGPHWRAGLGYAVGFGVLLLVVAIVKLPGWNERRRESKDAKKQQSDRPPRTGGGRIEVRGGGGSTPVSPKPRGGGGAVAPSVHPQVNLEERLIEYRVFVPEVEREVAAYRNSHPVFEDFRRVVEDKITPLALESVRARLEMEDTYGTQPVSKYDEKEDLAKEAINLTVASMYGEVVAEALDFYRLGNVKLGEREEKMWLSLVHEREAHGRRTTGPVTAKCPFEEGTVEALQYKQRLAQSATGFGHLLTRVLYKLPPDLEKKQREAEKLYDRVWEITPVDREDEISEKYVDDYRRMFRGLMQKTREEVIMHRLRRGRQQEGKNGN